MLLDIQGDMEAIKNTKKQMEKLQTEGRKELEKNKTCSSCVSFNIDFDEYPCKDCFNDGVLTNWH